PDDNFILWHVQTKGSVQPIPNRKSARPVGIRFLLDDRVMDAVHAWCDNQATEPTFSVSRHLDVGMVKENLDEQRRLPGRKSQRRNADGEDLSSTPRRRQNHLGEMEANRCRS